MYIVRTTVARLWYMRQWNPLIVGTIAMVMVYHHLSNAINNHPGFFFSCTSFPLPFVSFSFALDASFARYLCLSRLSLWLLVYWLNPSWLFLRRPVHSLRKYMITKGIYLLDSLAVMTFQSTGPLWGGRIYGGAERWAGKPALETMLTCEHLDYSKDIYSRIISLVHFFQQPLHCTNRAWEYSNCGESWCILVQCICLVLGSNPQS